MADLMVDAKEEKRVEMRVALTVDVKVVWKEEKRVEMRVVKTAAESVVE